MQEQLARANPDLIGVRRITLGDLKEVIAKGMSDFWAKPSHLLFLSLIYPVAMLVLARLLLRDDLVPMIFPVISGAALLGPFVAIGLYELSRRREKGLELHWRNAFDVFRSHSIGNILRLGILLAVLFVLWLVAAMGIYNVTMGANPPAGIGEFVERLFSTGAGWTLIIVGNAVGFIFAVVVLAISVVSFPLLLDRDVGMVVAVGTSLRAVAMNPVPMAAWGMIVAASLLIGSIPLFVGLALVMPVLGHSTWHLYRKVIEAE